MPRDALRRSHFRIQTGRGARGFVQPVHRVLALTPRGKCEIKSGAQKERVSCPNSRLEPFCWYLLYCWEVLVPCARKESAPILVWAAQQTARERRSINSIPLRRRM